MEGARSARVIGIGHNQPPRPCTIPGQPWPEDAQAIIFRWTQPVTTSGRAGTDQWILRFERRLPQTIEPLMGWTADEDTLTQVELRFNSREEAVAYAEREGLAYRVQDESIAATTAEREHACKKAQQHEAAELYRSAKYSEHDRRNRKSSIEGLSPLRLNNSALENQEMPPPSNNAKAFQELGISGAGGCPALLWLRCSLEDVAMRTIFDLSPLYRSTVGFDRLFDMLDRAADVEPVPAWPPYNVEKMGDDHYRVVMALAGFDPDEIEIVQKDNALIVSGRKQPEDERVQVLHRGIADRPFRQTFNLADDVSVTEAKLENGLLMIDLVREVPEELKPRRIEIASGGSPKTIEHEKAA